MQRLDIAIAGCGPCGLATALLLRRGGHQVSLFERFEAPRPIGSGLMIQPTGMAVLARLGLLDPIIAAGSRIDRLFGKADDRVVLNVRYAPLRRRDAFGIGIHRTSLFALLHQAVLDEGIPIHVRHDIVGSELQGSKRVLCFAERAASRPFDLIVDALGTRSRLAPLAGRELAYGALWANLDWPEHAGFDPHALEQRYRRSNIMAGILPIGTPPGALRPQAAFFWSLRADQLMRWHDAGIAAWKRDVAELWPACAPLLDQIDSPARLTFARYASHSAHAGRAGADPYR